MNLSLAEYAPDGRLRRRGMPFFYDSRNSGNGWKIRQLLSLLGLPYERASEPGGGRGAHAGIPGHKPLVARVPVLREADGLVLRESNAILAHLAQAPPTCRTPGRRAPR